MSRVVRILRNSTRLAPHTIIVARCVSSWTSCSSKRSHRTLTSLTGTATWKANALPSTRNRAPPLASSSSDTHTLAARQATCTTRPAFAFDASATSQISLQPPAPLPPPPSPPLTTTTKAAAAAAAVVVIVGEVFSVVTGVVETGEAGGGGGVGRRDKLPLASRQSSTRSLSAMFSAMSSPRSSTRSGSSESGSSGLFTDTSSIVVGISTCGGTGSPSGPGKHSRNRRISRREMFIVCCPSAESRLLCRATCSTDTWKSSLQLSLLPRASMGRKKTKSRAYTRRLVSSVGGCIVGGDTTKRPS
ncbi:hypothetical protein DQ04_01481100 [Trypanosoma grayi]|uniref:hypothetical protein n=1 Tax=Trypanosoma grayi TaxID=71804 RepID=UPI0004F498AB|nr:hypothetical protein DQ04_01481100 [Trypanosoma grayi]KEG12707.1 hypothetical protein DQ04_01481100 [Trypanosoma grayi]